MTRQALAQDRGLQAERTALAWNRTGLAIAASGVLVLLRNADTFNVSHDVTRVAVVAAVAVLAAAVCGFGVHRRRQLARGDYFAMHYLPLVGLAVVAEGALILAYLMRIG
ncbi:DUF202 domain-containing protein [Mycobacterium sp. PDNC021]|uniref:DUF202 domain-containing protein n=1 Tax=Mycobacterium sp. PDNC021 TaxID=3391399 RepID=UPI003AAE802E